MAEKDCLENGHCALHGQEVERRQEVRTDLKNLDDKLDEKVGQLWSKIAFLDSESSGFRGQARIAGVIAVLIFGSSFIYTKGHINDADQVMQQMQADHVMKIEAVKANNNREFDKVHRLVNSNEAAIDILETNSLLMDQRLRNIESSTNRIEQRLSQLVSILADSGDITPTEKYRWDYTPEGDYE